MSALFVLAQKAIEFALFVRQTLVRRAGCGGRYALAQCTTQEKASVW